MANIRRKKYIIKSRVRFTIFIIIVFAILATAITAVIIKANHTEKMTMTKQNYTQIKVAPGDTLWSIADEYMPQDMDRRQSVYIISQVNNTSASELCAGQILSIPIQVDKI